MLHFDMNDLHWADRGLWPKEIKIGACGLAAVFGFLCIYVIWCRPLFTEYAQSITEETHLKNEFEKKYRQVVNLDVYKKQLKDMEKRFGQVLKALPTQNEMPALLEDISKTGVASGLTFELFAPTKEIEHPFYVELPVNITVIGTYHQLAVFLSRIAQINRIVTIHDFTLTALKLDKSLHEQVQHTQSEQLIMSITIKIYRYKPS